MSHDVSHLKVRELSRLSRETLWINAYRGVLESRKFGANAQGCEYRSEDYDGNVTKCAIGHSIPDVKYDAGMETVSAGVLVTGERAVGSQTGGKWSAVTRLHNRAKFILQLQGIHDRCADDIDFDGYAVEDETDEALREFRTRMIEFAKLNKLKVDPKVV